MRRMIRVAGATYQLKGKDVDVSDIVVRPTASS